MAQLTDPNDPMTQVIEDAVNDATAPVEEETTEEVATETPESTTVSAEDAAAEIAEETTPVEDESVQVAAPGTKAKEPKVEDDFAKKFGLQPNSVTGRENRIPYSRVKKIVEKNERDTIARVTKEIEAKFQPQLTQLTEFDTKVKDYEGRLEKVAQFEDILTNDPKTFLGMLSQVPAYKEFFEYIEKATAAFDAAGAPAAAPIPYLDATSMPQPDQVLSDGSKVYSMAGLQARDEWLAKQIEDKAVKQAEERLAKRYAPIEQAWQSQEQMAKIIPVVEKQIAEARTWDKFAELEPKVLEILKADKNISLEKAYVKAYQEAVAAERTKFTTDRNTIRSEVLAEIKKKPISSGSPVSAVKPQSETFAGPTNTEDVIRRSLEEAGLLGK